LPWYIAVMIVLCAIIGPFEALHIYNKAQEMKQRRRAQRDGKDEPPAEI